MFVLELKIIPRSSVNKFVQEDLSIKLKITAAPVDGEANKKIIDYLSKKFSCPKTSIKLLVGEKSKHKTFCFNTLTEDEGTKILQNILLEG